MPYRFEFRHAWEKTKRVGPAEMVSTIVGAIAGAATGSVATAVGGGVLAGVSVWVIHYGWHLWLAPSEVATADRIALERQYEKLTKKNAEFKTALAAAEKSKLPAPELSVGRLTLGGAGYWVVGVINTGPPATFTASMRVVASRGWRVGAIHDLWWHKEGASASKIPTGSMDACCIGQIDMDRFANRELNLCEYDRNTRTNRAVGRQGWVPGNNRPLAADLDITISGERDGAHGNWKVRVLFGPYTAEVVDAPAPRDDRPAILATFLDRIHQHEQTLNAPPEIPPPSESPNEEPT